MTTDNTNKIIISSLFVGLLLCFGLIVHQYIRLGSLQKRVDAQEESIEKSRVVQMRSLDSGIYRLEVLTDQFGKNETTYTIYNISIGVRVGRFRRNFQIGYGDGDDASSIFYFDNDSDGLTDTKTAVKYLRTIPVAGIVSLYMFDPAYSQLAYDIFQSNLDKAEKLSLDQMSRYVDDKIIRSWDYVKENADDIASWIEDSVEFDR